MTENNKYIIALSKASLFNIQPENPPKSIDWQYIYDKAKEQSIVAFLAYSIEKLPKELQPDNIDKWRKVIITTGFLMEVKHRELDRMMEIYADNNIYPIFLKGVVVKELYPVPELRTMGDFDIWVDSSERAAAEELFIKEGYTIRRDTLYSEVDKGQVHGEIFISLEDDFRADPKLWDSRLKKNTIVDTKGRKILSPTYELAYSVIHAAKHLTREGCGIRNIFDAALIIAKRGANIDFDLAEDICRSQGYEQVYGYILTAVNMLYGIDVPKDKLSDIKLTYKFIDYILSYGVFGRDIEGNVLNAQVARREGDNVGMIRRIFFPPRKMMWHKYQYLKISPLLTPVGWIHRIITAVFIKKYSVKSMIKGVNKSIEYGNERDKKLEEIKLK